MRATRLLSTTTAIILIGGGIAAAQGMKTDEAPGRAPAAQKAAPAEKVAPPMAQHPAKPKETTGQGAEQHQGGATPKAEGAEHRDRGAKPQAAEKGDKDKMGTKSSEKTGEKTGAKTQKSEMKPGEKTGQKTEKSEMKNGAAAGEKGENKSAAGKSEQRSTTGQGAAGAAKLSTEQRTKITSVIRQHKVEPAHLDVSIAVGVRVPERVHLYPLPVEVVEVYPEWRGYDYIQVGDEIVVINPRTHEIVAILEA
jgi:hypothetical protein